MAAKTTQTRLQPAASFMETSCASLWKRPRSSASMAVTKAMKPAQRAGEPMESMGTKVSERGGLGVGFRGCSGERLWTCAGCNRRP